MFSLFANGSAMTSRARGDANKRPHNNEGHPRIVSRKNCINSQRSSENIYPLGASVRQSQKDECFFVFVFFFNIVFIQMPTHKITDINTHNYNYVCVAILKQRLCYLCANLNCVLTVCFNYCFHWVGIHRGLFVWVCGLFF